MSQRPLCQDAKALNDWRKHASRDFIGVKRTDGFCVQWQHRAVFRFLENGDKVKVTLRFRGREMAHQELGRDLLERVADDIEGTGKVENMPKMEGRQMIMMIGPVK